MATNVKYFGVDVGGTTIKIGAFDAEKTLIEKWSIPTAREDEGRALFRELEKALSDYMTRQGGSLQDIEGIGLGVPGPVLENRYINQCVNIGLGYTDLQEVFHPGENIRIIADNDANMAALGEFHFGAAKQFDSILFITLGTGIGGGVIHEGQLITGAHAAAGEIGHIKVFKNMLDELSEDTMDDLEYIVSGISLEKLAKRFLELPKWHLSQLHFEEPTAKYIFEMAKVGDPLATKLVSIMARYLGLAFTYAAAMLDFEAVIIGGGVSKAGDYLIRQIEDYYLQYAFHPLHECKFVQAELLNDAGIYGAVSRF